MKNKIKNEISNFCKECISNNNCPESECILYRIEKLIINNKEKKFKKGISMAINYLKENAGYDEESETFCYDLNYIECTNLLHILEKANINDKKLKKYLMNNKKYIKKLQKELAVIIKDFEKIYYENQKLKQELDKLKENRI